MCSQKSKNASRHRVAPGCFPDLPIPGSRGGCLPSLLQT